MIYLFTEEHNLLMITIYSHVLEVDKKYPVYTLYTNFIIDFTNVIKKISDKLTSQVSHFSRVQASFLKTS